MTRFVVKQKLEPGMASSQEKRLLCFLLLFLFITIFPRLVKADSTNPNDLDVLTSTYFKNSPAPPAPSSRASQAEDQAITSSQASLEHQAAQRPQGIETRELVPGPSVAMADNIGHRPGVAAESNIEASVTANTPVEYSRSQAPSFSGAPPEPVFERPTSIPDTRRSPAHANPKPLSGSGIPLVLTSSNYSLVSVGGKLTKGRIVVKNVDNRPGSFSINNSAIVKVDPNSSCIVSQTMPGATCGFNLSYAGTNGTTRTLSPVIFKIRGGNGSDFFTVNAINVPGASGASDVSSGQRLIVNTNKAPAENKIPKIVDKPVKTTFEKPSVITRNNNSIVSQNQKPIQKKIIKYIDEFQEEEDLQQVTAKENLQQFSPRTVEQPVNNLYYQTKSNQVIEKEESLWRLYIGIMAGVSRAKVGNAQVDIVSDVTPYWYDSYVASKTKGGVEAYGINVGLEFNLAPNLFASFGLGAYKSINHKGKGAVYLKTLTKTEDDGTKTSSADENGTLQHNFDYEFNLLTSQLMFETKLAVQIPIYRKTKLIPFVLAGIGTSINYVSNYEETKTYKVDLDVGFKSNVTVDFAYEFGGGAAFSFNDHDRLFVAYRYVHLGNANFARRSGGDFPLTANNNKAHEIYVGYTHLFNF
jgi:opacity protein-like surface antigen